MLSTWLDEHLETFVRPQLGGIPDIDNGYWMVRAFNTRRLVAMNAVWHKVKERAEGRPILLPGRDVYLFEVIARMLNDYPTICRVDISTSTMSAVTEDYSHTLCLDTGYKGSVPKALKIPNWVLLRYTPPYPAGTTEKTRADDLRKYQVFPQMKRGEMMSLSAELEGCPKYWHRATMTTDRTAIMQSIDHGMFKTAAMITMLVARSVHLMKPVRKRRMFAIYSQGRLL